MRGLLCAVHALVFVLVLVSSPERSSGFIGKILDELHRFDKNVLRKVSEPVNDVLHKFDKNVLRPAAEPVKKMLHEFDKNVLREAAKPVKEVLHEFDKNVLRKVVKALGLRRIRKTYQEFKQEVVHSKVTFTADSYRVEKIVPCPDGQHDIMDAEQPVEIYFEDGVKLYKTDTAENVASISSVRPSERMNFEINPERDSFKEGRGNILNLEVYLGFLLRNV